MKVQEQIDTMQKIIRGAIYTSPTFLKGLLIPEYSLEEFFWAIEYLSKKAKDSEKYWEQIIEATRNGEKATWDFMKALIDNKIKFVKKD